MGYLKLSLVSCPIALYPATSEREKISFHQLNKETGNRIRYRKVDAETGDEVEQAAIIKGFEVDKGQYVELDPEELEAVAIESKRTIEIEKFVPKTDIDEIYMRDPYFIVPDGEVGQQTFAVIREVIRKEGMVALGKVVFTSREHVIALEARDKGMMGITLRYPYEVRDQNEYFDGIENEKVPKDMLDLAIHIVETKKGKFERGRAQGPDQEEAERREDRAPSGAGTHKRREPHGRPAAKRESGSLWRTAKGHSIARQERQEADRRAARNAAADRRQEGQGSRKARGTDGNATEKGRLGLFGRFSMSATSRRTRRWSNYPGGQASRYSLDSRH
jgi:DNA end-binding protein Ku